MAYSPNDLAAWLAPASTALLVVDAQNDYLHEDGAVSRLSGTDMGPGRATLPRLSQLIRAARASGVVVIYLRNAHASANTLPNKVARRPAGPERFWPEVDSWGYRFHVDLEQPSADDLIITKHNYDGFQDTALRLHLQAMGIENLVVTGYATEVCVESTCRRAFVEGYYVTVPPETTSGFSEAAVTASLNILGSKFGSVISADEVEAVWSAAAQ